MNESYERWRTLAWQFRVTPSHLRFQAKLHRYVANVTNDSLAHTIIMCNADECELRAAEVSPCQIKPPY
ncbi:MAG TPA: hypothetical protein VEP90_24135 [Methylomirabilota bacterium]|nr:hypothetical protein [Methylomirabilota bacterium]